MANMNIVTLEELETFKQSLLDSLSVLLAEQQPVPVPAPARRWMKSNELRQLLPVSPAALYQLRERGVIPFTKMDGVIFYDYEEICRLFDSNKSPSLKPPSRLMRRKFRQPSAPAGPVGHEASTQMLNVNKFDLSL